MNEPLSTGKEACSNWQFCCKSLEPPVIHSTDHRSTLNMTAWPNQLIPWVQDSDKFSTQGLQSTDDPGANLCWIKNGGSECWILVIELQTSDMCTWKDLGATISTVKSHLNELADQDRCNCILLKGNACWNFLRSYMTSRGHSDCYVTIIVYLHRTPVYSSPWNNDLHGPQLTKYDLSVKMIWSPVRTVDHGWLCNNHCLFT